MLGNKWTFYIFQYLWNAISRRPSMLLIQVSKLPSMLRFLPKCTCSTHFINHASDMTLMALEQLGVPQCISSWPATAAVSKYFKILTSKYDLQKFPRLMRACMESRQLCGCPSFFFCCVAPSLNISPFSFHGMSSHQYWFKFTLRNFKWQLLASAKTTSWLHQHTLTEQQCEGYANPRFVYSFFCFFRHISRDAPD